MKRIWCSLLVLLLGAVPSMAAAVTLTGDPSHSSATFSVMHLAISNVAGSIPVVSWNGTTDAGYMPTSVNATLDAKGIDTKEADRDSDLRSDRWFDVAKYPTMTFKSSKIEPGPSGTFKMTGDLTMHGVTKPVSLEGKLLGTVKDGRQRIHVGYTATTTIDRRDFGLNFAGTVPEGQLVAGYDVTITINAEGIVAS